MITSQNPKWVHAIPPGSRAIVTMKLKGGFSAPVVELNNRIGVSDSKFMGVLAMLGVDPDNDNPRVQGDRAWWWFDDSDGKIKKMVVAYYSAWNGETGHLSFIRACIEMSYKFSNKAKETKEFVQGYQPATLRRLT